MKRHTPVPGDLRWSYSLRRYVSECQTCGHRIEERGAKWRHVTEN